jgi:very-short-patch-repair endonuclease
VRTQGNAEADRRCMILAETQHGLVCGDQLGGLGLNRQALARRQKSGQLVSVLPGIYRTAGTPSTWLLFVRATHMWLRERGALSHRTAAALQGLVEGSPRPIEISTAAYLRSPHKDIQVRRVVDLQSRDLRWFDGMRITNPTRTVIDLAGILDRKRLDFAIDEARRRRLIAERPVRETLERLGRQGRAGAGLMAKILEEGEFHLLVPGSPFERKLLHFLDSHRFPRPERQYEIFDDQGDFLARVDFAYPHLMIAIECDGKKHHFGTRAWERDVERRSRLAALGWRVIHISWELLTTRSEELLALLRSALGYSWL